MNSLNSKPFVAAVKGEEAVRTRMPKNGSNGGRIIVQEL